MIPERAERERKAEKAGKVYKSREQRAAEREQRLEQQRIERERRAAERAATPKPLPLKELYRLEYWVWQSFLQRCYRPTHRKFKNYGARGIFVCEGLRFGDGEHNGHGTMKGFARFVAGYAPKPAGLLIDRIDNDGSYTCGSCAECMRMGYPNNLGRGYFD